MGKWHEIQIWCEVEEVDLNAFVDHDVICGTRKFTNEISADCTPEEVLEWEKNLVESCRKLYGHNPKDCRCLSDGYAYGKVVSSGHRKISY